MTDTITINMKKTIPKAPDCSRCGYLYKGIYGELHCTLGKYLIPLERNNDYIQPCADCIRARMEALNV